MCRPLTGEEPHFSLLANGCGSNQWYHFGVGKFTTHFRTYFSGDWDVHRGYDLDFDPWPNRRARLDVRLTMIRLFGRAGPRHSRGGVCQALAASDDVQGELVSVHSS